MTVHSSQGEWKSCVYKPAECFISHKKTSVKKRDFFPPKSDSIQKSQSVCMAMGTSWNFRGNVKQSKLRIHKAGISDHLLELVELNLYAKFLTVAF